jgi:hypothetical protein
MSRLVALYPAAWRARYGDEMEALLAAHPPTLADRLDLVRGALDARIHPQVPRRGRVADWRGFAAFLGFVALYLAVLVAANGPIMRDEFGTYREGGAALPVLVASMILLSIGLFAIVERLPPDDTVSRSAGWISIAAGLLWSFAPWTLPAGLAFLLGLLVLAVGARRAGILPTAALLVLAVAAAVPAGLFVAQLFLPWYALRLSGLNLLVVIGPVSLVWLVVGAVNVRGRELPPAV